MNIYFSMMMTAIAFFAILIIRNQLVFSIRGRALDIIVRYNKDELARWVARAEAGQVKSTVTYEEIEATLLKYPTDREPSYDQMLWDLTKWSFPSFYPDLVSVEGHQINPS